MIRDELQSEFKDAMKSGDTRRRDTIRQINSEAALRRSEPGFQGEEDDEFYLEVIGSYVKKMDKARREYAAMGERGAEMADQLGWEVEYLSRWLPSRLDEDATRRLVEEAIAVTGAAGDPKARGRVIGAIMKDHRDEVDGALVNRIVGELLGD